MDISDHKIIKKTSQWIPIKKWRHNARKSIYGIIQKEKFKILDKYLELTTYTNDRNTIKDIVKKTPFGRFGDCDEVFGTVHYLCSDAAKFVTGTVIAIDGGFSAFSGV